MSTNDAVRPRVTVFGYASLDGRITLGRDRLLLPWGPSAEDAHVWERLVGPSKEVYETLKAELQPQVFLEGSESFVTSAAGAAAFDPVEGPETELYRDYLPAAVLDRPGATGWMAVPDSRGRVRWGMKEVEGVHALVLASKKTPAPYLQFLRAEQIPYLICGDDRVDLRLALSRLASELGVRTVLCQSPGKLAGALLEQGLVDEVGLVLLPAIVGGFDTASLFRMPERPPGESPVGLELQSVERLEGGRLWLRYRVLPEP